VLVQDPSNSECIQDLPVHFIRPLTPLSWRRPLPPTDYPSPHPTPPTISMCYLLTTRFTISFTVYYLFNSKTLQPTRSGRRQMVICWIKSPHGGSCYLEHNSRPSEPNVKMHAWLLLSQPSSARRITKSRDQLETSGGHSGRNGERIRHEGLTSILSCKPRLEVVGSGGDLGHGTIE